MTSVVAAPAEVLTEAAAVRALTPDEAAQERPVRLRGVVTFFDSVRRYAFLQDATAGIFFFPGALAEPGALQLRTGDELEIEGRTWPGGFAPTVEAGGGKGLPVKVTVLGRAPLPEPVPFPPSALSDDSFHNRYVELRGVVRTLEEDRATKNLILSISTRGGVLKAFIPDFDSAKQTWPSDWQNIEVRLHGVFSVGGNPQRQRSELRLFIPTMSEVWPEPENVARAFAEAPRGFHTLTRFDAEGSPEKRVRVEGVVTLAEPGRGIYLRDSGAGLWVESVQTLALTVGDRVSAIGFATLAGARPILLDAILRREARSAPPEPMTLTLAQARSGVHHANLAQIDAQLVDAVAGPAGARVLVLETEGRRFRAELAKPSGASSPRLKSWLRVAGICLNEAAQTDPADGGFDFHLKLRAPTDVLVLREPPWWTPQRIALVIGGLIAGIAGTAFWGLLLRRQVARQTAIIQEKLAHEVLWKERHRMARELHDTLEQQLVGISMQLEAATVNLPESAQAPLHLTRAMIQHSRSEARRSVWDLRSQVLEHGGLVAALRETATALTQSGQPEIEISVLGPARRLNGQVELHLLRIAQEAMTNAIKHGTAPRIEVQVSFQEAVIGLRVSDNGSGFAVPQATDPVGAHFGLLGMRERAAKLNTALRLDSAPGRGTAVAIEVNVAAFEEASAQVG